MFSRKSPCGDNFQMIFAVKNSIKFFHNSISPFMLCKCRYYPSCSQYTLDAIDDRGVFLGLAKGVLRILRCNPLFPGGYDPYKKETTEGTEEKDIV